jgi:hypothetical protein
MFEQCLRGGEGLLMTTGCGILRLTEAFNPPFEGSSADSPVSDRLSRTDPDRWQIDEDS